jgi:hypothetical protein
MRTATWNFFLIQYCRQVSNIEGFPGVRAEFYFAFYGINIVQGAPNLCIRDHDMFLPLDNTVEINNSKYAWNIQICPRITKSFISRFIQNSKFDS